MNKNNREERKYKENEKIEFLLQEYNSADNFDRHCVNFVTAHINFLILVFGVYITVVVQNADKVDRYLWLGIFGIFIGFLGVFILRIVIREYVQSKSQKWRMEKIREYILDEFLKVKDNDNYKKAFPLYPRG